MASNTQNIQKFWRNLRDNGKSILQCGALIYIRCNAEKLDTTSALNKEEYAEVCGLVMEIFISGESNASKEAAKTLPVILKYFRKHSLKFFEAALHVDRDKRLKIFQFLETLDDSCFIAAVEDPSMLDFIEDSLSSIQTSSMEWLSSTSCTENLTMLQAAENKAPSAAEELEEIIVSNALVLLRRSYKTAITVTDIQSIEKFDAIVMEKVVTLAYLGHKRQRGPAIQLVNQAIDADLTMRLKTKHSEIYQRYKKNIQGHYSTRMLLLVKACETDWSRLWSISIRILGTDLHRGALLINKLLGVEERAFKSNDPIVRREAFVSWKLLIDNLAIDMKELATQRRVRLLCVPLTANNSKSELIALKKLEIWWYLIVKLYPNISPFVDPVVTQFLNFCFGPLGDTPLLSKKCDVIASPGKRFFKSKIYSIDALLQLIVPDQKNRKMMAPILDERLPNAIGEALFAQCYKAFLHSVGEAVFIIGKFDINEMKSRYEVSKVLWVNLMHYIRKTSVEPKTNVYNELIVVISALQTCSMEMDFFDDFFRDVIVPELSASANDLMYKDNTLVDLMTKIMVPKFLMNLHGKQCDAVKCLMWQTTRPETSTNYHPETLRFLETTLEQLRSVPMDNDSLTDCYDLWFVYAEIAYKFMKAHQNFNEGTTTEINFKTIDSIISFPFTHMYWANSMQAQKIAIHWKDVYKKYECQADTITSIKPNEIFDNTTKMIEACLVKNEKCYRVAVYCLDALMGTINYKFLLAENDVPTIVRIVSDLTTIALHGRQTTEAECTLKALSSLLITVYGHSPEKVLSYMNFTSQTIELMLKTDAEDVLMKEITSTWETIVSILRGLSNLLDEKFLQSYKQVLLLSLRHAKTEITSQTLSILELKDNINDNARAILAELSRVHKKFLGKDATKTKIDKADRTPKSTRITGSFLNRQIQSPRAFSLREKQEAEKKATQLLPDPDSQDYVVIRSEVKLDVNRLTEHQKESLKRRRDDIPAMYNDLSQSSSQDTQDLQTWFVGKKTIDDSPTPVIDDEKSPIIDEKSTNDREIGKIAEDSRVGKKIETPISNKNTSKSMESENKVAAIIHRGETMASSGQDPTSESALLGESSITNETQKTSDNSKEQLPTEKPISRNEPTPVSDDSYVKETKSPDAADSSCNDQTNIVVKKLNFESRDEYPDEKDEEKNELSPSDVGSSNKTNRCRRSVKTSETNSAPAATRGTAKYRGKASETVGEMINPENAEIPAGTFEKSKDAIKTRGNTFRAPTVASTTERGIKRKAASDGENEDKNEREKKRKTSIKSSSCTVEDNEHTALSQATKRTEIEISRLRIDMVSDGPLTSRRRSKYNDDNANSQRNTKKSNLPDPKGSRSRGLRSRVAVNSRRSSKTSDKDDMMKKARKRVATVQDNEKNDAKKKENEDNLSAKSLRSRSRRKRNLQERGVASESQTIIDDEDTTNESVCSNRDSDKSMDSTKSNIENNDNPVEDNVPPNTSASPVVETTETVMDLDLDEVVESSQDSTVLTGSHKRSFSKIIKLTSPEETELPIVVSIESSIENKQPTSSSPIMPLSSHVVAAAKDDEEKVTNDDQDETFLDISAIRPQLADDVPIEDTEKKTPEASKTMASPVSTAKAPEANFNFSSPKGHTKRFTKPKSFASQGRAAHMLGLVTKLAVLEKDGQVDKNQVDEEIATIKRSRMKEMESEIAIAKRDRANIVREPERMGSPSGSRQEKIFNNMKSADYAASPPGKLFSNLRNNGEKISPKMEKSQGACQDNGNSAGIKDDDCNVSFANDKDELPMLEWSSANPPSLTASPSASILKRNRWIVNESDTEPTTPNRIPRKRVSFADPPVSKEMGYEIENAGSPHKIVKFSSARPLSARKDSPIRIKQSRFVMIQMDIDKPDKEAEEQPLSCDIDINSDKENSDLLLKITGDFENFGNSQNSGKIGSPVLNASEKSLIANIIGCGTIEAEKSKKHCDNNVGKSGESLKHVPIEEAPTQDDLFNSSDEKIDSPNKNSDLAKDVVKEPISISEQSSIVESFKLNVTDDSVIGSITDLRREETSVPDSLEDTIDVRNITSLNSTGNTDDSFGEIPVRTSTQAPDPMNEMDTLPVADSMLSLPPMSQDSQESTQATVEIPRPELLNSTDAIYPNLDECHRPIEDIVDNLTNPLWRKNLMNHLETRSIRTVGDLARLSEREIVRIPFKGSSKINFVREVLRKFEQKLRTSCFDDKTNNDIVDERFAASSMENETIEVTRDQENDELPCEIRKSLGDISALASIAKFPEDLASLDVSRLDSLAPNDFASVESLNPDVLVPLGRTSTANSVSTIIIDSSTEPEVSNVYDDTKNVSDIPTINLSSDLTQITTRTVGTLTNPPAETSNKSAQSQVRLDELLDEIDVDVLLRSAIKRTTADKLLTEYKLKMEDRSEMELCKETVRILGISNDTLLKLACHECGVKKVLCELPNIFYSDDSKR